MLTRKDFIKKADELIEWGKSRNWKKRLDKKDLPEIISNWIEYFKQSNPRFDENRFRDYIERGIYG
jgi:hypothetical protein